MEHRIYTRLAELEQAERQAELELIVIRTVIKELRALVQPEAPVVPVEELVTEVPTEVANGRGAPPVDMNTG